MTYKTILVHLSDEKTFEPMLEVACNLARRFEAHLIGLFVVPTFVPPSAVEVPYSSELLEVNRKAQRQIAARIKTAFEATVANQSFVGEWRCADGAGRSVGEVVFEQARCVDLTILRQGGAEDSYSQNDVIERTAFESGHPVLIVPTAGRFPTIGSKVLLAWNGRREATRAVWDALPLLQSAEQVHVLTVNPQKVAASADLPGSELAATLSRHGVNCETAHTITSELGVGDIMLNYTAENAIDLIVMGCYGHSRLRELVFGGATKNILEHMTAPVLMSH